jgi:CHASE2 domain-containing sensor protein
VTRPVRDREDMRVWRDDVLELLAVVWLLAWGLVCWAARGFRLGP